MRPTFYLILVVATFSAIPEYSFALKQETASKHANHYPDPVFLKKTDLNVKRVLSPPPTPGSKQDQADFERILGYQSTRTEEECKRAAFVVDVALNTLFGPTSGPLTEAEVKQWSEFFEKVRIDADYFVQETKKHWGRLRPYFANEKVSPCVHKERTKAYPSGHAAISRVFAQVLAEIDPTRKSAFQARADRIAEDRVLAGVHHPADIESGKKLGDEVFKKLTSNPKFKKALHWCPVRGATGLG